MAETYTFTWTINIITNKNNKMKINISQNATSIDIAKANIINDILKLSRYGVPCYIVDNKNKKYKITYIDKSATQQEYYVIDSTFTTTICYGHPDVKPIKNGKTLNVNAKPFVPNSTTNTNTYNTYECFYNTTGTNVGYYNYNYTNYTNYNNF